MKFIKRVFIICVITFLVSCDTIFEYTVYDADVKEEHKNTTTKNLEALNKIKVNSQNFKFAFLTDSHYFYDNLKTVVDDINKNNEILFLLFGGDITEQALLKEYEIFYDIMADLQKPYFTVIGNHDYNSNGNLIYSRIFGDYNYTFQFNNNKFILFDDIVWESKKSPDFEWLSLELKDRNSFNEVFVIAHIPPNGDQFTEEMSATYKTIMSQNNVPLSMHGHTHSYNYEEGDVSYLTIPSLKELAYGIVTVQEKSFSVELIEL
ncbi:metallophosphoesterase family protein [Polaribacter sp. R77954]|uniref:metallophosphoesterase family protein n=1 Tax=Polaribacter sp. R77954 TaxID=3093870 RepID=UPI0037C70513